jgi:hypothetical protein
LEIGLSQSKALFLLCEQPCAGQSIELFVFTYKTVKWASHSLGPAGSSTWLEGGAVELAFDCPRCTLGAADLLSDGAWNYRRCGHAGCRASEST